MSNKLLIVGIVGKLNTGKDTVADIFIKEGFLSVAFADPLKNIVKQLFDIPTEVLWGPSQHRTGEVRQMLQELGTDYARKFRPNIWIDKMRKTLAVHRALVPTGYIVIPDVRFLNEAEMLHNMGAYFIRVTRPGHGAHETEKANTHESEIQTESIPDNLLFTTIVNNGTLATLKDVSKEILKDIRHDAAGK